MSDAGQRVLGALLLAAGIAAAGWLVGDGFRAGRTAERFVTVKGIAEQPVRADLALWPFRFVATGNQLAEAQAKLARDAETVHAFLREAGLPGEAIDLRSIEVNDLLAQAYRSGPVESRFIVAQTLMVRTHDVDRVVAASQQVGRLVDAGVVLTSERGPEGAGPIYLFTRLTDLKPGMIAEATRNARAAAEQFARDSGSGLGPIRRANQGLFQVLPRDEVPGASEQRQVEKTLRVVSTIEYLLED